MMMVQGWPGLSGACPGATAYGFPGTLRLAPGTRRLLVFSEQPTPAGARNPSYGGTALPGPERPAGILRNESSWFLERTPDRMKMGFIGSMVEGSSILGQGRLWFGAFS